jgi:hypothetical protein
LLFSYARKDEEKVEKLITDHQIFFENWAFSWILDSIKTDVQKIKDDANSSLSGVKITPPPVAQKDSIIRQDVKNNTWNEENNNLLSKEHLLWVVYGLIIFLIIIIISYVIIPSLWRKTGDIKNNASQNNSRGSNL